jgi:hypothetical protein
MGQTLRVRRFEPASVTLSSGREIRLKVKRLDVGESADFDRLFSRAMTRESDRLLLARRPGEELDREVRSAISSEDLEHFTASAAILGQLRKAGKESIDAIAGQAIDVLHALLKAVAPTERFVLPDEEIRRRRYLQLTDAERTTYDRLKSEDEQAFEGCVREALERFVRVEPGQIELEDEDADGQVTVTDVTNGLQLASVMGGEGGALVSILLIIKAKNRLSDDEKKASGSRSTSKSSSSAPDQTAPGDSRRPTAGSAEPSDSVTTEAVMASVPTPSGATGV